MALVSVLVYRPGPSGRVLVRADFLDASPCHACNDTGRFTAAHSALAVTVACPFCWRRNP